MTESSGLVQHDEILESTINEIIQILELDDSEKSDEILQDLIENGYQSLFKYEDYLIPEIFTEATKENNNEIRKNLIKYFERQWILQYGCGNEWFVSFLTQYQLNENCDLYTHVLNRTAQYGNKYMKECPVLSIVLQILFEGIDDQCLLESNVFNDLWTTITNDGLRSITQYHDYIAKDIMDELIDKKQLILFQALCLYYRPELFKQLKETNITNRHDLYDLTLNHVAEQGWLNGLEAVKHKIVPILYRKLLKTIPCKKQEQEYQWYWQSNSNPWSTQEKAEFAAYPSNNSQIIERAYLNKENEVVLNEHYKIDFNNRVQINLSDVQKRRPVIRRQAVSPNRTASATQINQRYQLSSNAIRSSTTDSNLNQYNFVDKWFIAITKGKLKKPESEIVELAINGITAEAELFPEREKAITYADRAANELRHVQHAAKLIIQEVCIKLYTEEEFLYRVINTTLRSNDETKLETLGPICYLLYDYVGRPQQNAQGRLTKDDILYRGERLAPDAIEDFRRSIGTNQVWMWTQFVSTSKFRSVAEKFGDRNSLYIIEMKEPNAWEQGVYISRLSNFAIEHEVLLPPGIKFKITKMEEEGLSKRPLIYISIWPSHISTLH